MYVPLLMTKSLSAWLCDSKQVISSSDKLASPAHVSYTYKARHTGEEWATNLSCERLISKKRPTSREHLIFSHHVIAQRFSLSSAKKMIDTKKELAPHFHVDNVLGGLHQLKKSLAEFASFSRRHHQNCP